MAFKNYMKFGFETEERKMDQVLHKTHKLSRQVTNQTARTFSGQDCQQGALSTGEKVQLKKLLI